MTELCKAARLFVDIESTMLHPRLLTVLEIAWCLTDLDGTQRTPIRQRFCRITVNEDGPCYPDVVRARNPNNRYPWINQNDGDPYALNMAVESGLYDDWCAATPAALVVTSSAELARLIIDDICEHCDLGERNPDWSPNAIRMPGDPVSPWLSEPERIYLSGMGVAQFDQPVLRELMPAVVPAFGHAGLTHYRPGGDVSIAQTAMLGGCEDVAVIEWYQRTYGYPTITLGGVPDYCWANRDVLSWLSDKRVHRAAADVARGIVLQRALWAYGKNLREWIGLEGES